MDLGEKTRIKTQKKNENNITKQELSSVSEDFVALALAFCFIFTPKWYLIWVSSSVQAF